MLKMTAVGAFVKERNQERFRRLYDAHYRSILAYFVRRLDSASSPEDLAEDVFVIAWNRLDRVPPGDEARYWLYGVARRVLANHDRKAGTARRFAPRLRETVQHPVSVEAAAIARDEEAAVRDAISHLREGDREVIRLAYWDELPHEAIGSILGCSRSAVDVRLHRAVRRLRKALARSRHFCDEETPTWTPEETAC